VEYAEIHPKGILKQYSNNKNSIQIASGTTLREALIQIGIPPELVAMAFVNQNPKGKEEIVLAGEIIDLVAVIGGG
jgi:sulfur carrier protein ThiS